MTYPWQQPATVSPEFIAQTKRYAALYSVPDYPACETDPDEEDCETCGNTGNSPVVNGEFVFDAPCNDCWRGDHLDEMLRESGGGR